MISNTIVCPSGYTDIGGKCVKIPDAEDDMDNIPDYLPELGVPDMFPDYLQPQIPDIVVPDFNRPNRPDIVPDFNIPDIPDFNRPDIVPDFPNVSDFEDLIDEGMNTIKNDLAQHIAPVIDDITGQFQELGDDLLNKIGISDMINDFTDPDTMFQHFVDEFAIQNGKKLVKFTKNLMNNVEKITESIEMHKYGKLAEIAYDNFYSFGDDNRIKELLTDPKYSYIEDLKDFVVDRELSSFDDLVLHNPVTGETVVSFRGTSRDLASLGIEEGTGDIKSFLNDWKANVRHVFGDTEQPRMIAADKLMKEVIDKYGKTLDSLTVAGHTSSPDSSATRSRRSSYCPLMAWKSRGDASPR